MKDDKKINKRWIAIILFGIAIILFTIAFMMSTQNKNNSSNGNKNINTNSNVEVTNNYTAYIKINPEIKLLYSVTCLDNKCEEPVVNSYELINNDAKEMLSDINLLNDSKNLTAVVELICSTLKSKNIEFNNVEVYSDWNDINTYLKNNNDYTYTTNVVEKTELKNLIENQNGEVTTEEVKQEEVKEEVKQEEKKLETIPETTSETQVQSNPRNDYTIYLSDNVNYTISGEAYCCTDCFSNDLINEITKAKGYKLIKGESSMIDFRKIASLSEPYNSATYFGNNLVSKLVEAGGENCAGLGGGEELLTKDICSEYNLICE